MPEPGAPAADLVEVIMPVRPLDDGDLRLGRPGAGRRRFKWDWQHTRTRVISALACFQVVTLDLYGYLGWRPPELAA